MLTFLLQTNNIFLQMFAYSKKNNENGMPVGSGFIIPKPVLHFRYHGTKNKLSPPRSRCVVNTFPTEDFSTKSREGEIWSKLSSFPTMQRHDKCIQVIIPQPFSDARPRETAALMLFRKL
jgi:hypothetical protein